MTLHIPRDGCSLSAREGVWHGACLRLRERRLLLCFTRIRLRLVHKIRRVKVGDLGGVKCPPQHLLLIKEQVSDCFAGSVTHAAHRMLRPA